MLLEISDRAEFADKFAALMASNVSLITAGVEPSADLSSKMIDEFLNQFIATTPSAAPRKSAGWVVVNNMSGYVPLDFRGLTYETADLAQAAANKWFASHQQGRISAYSVREATYFG